MTELYNTLKKELLELKENVKLETFELQDPLAITDEVITDEEITQGIRQLAIMSELYTYVCDFIQKHKIGHPESIEQSDFIVLEAPEFIEKCCEIVGYYDLTKEE